MNKSELVTAISEKGKLTKKYAEDALDAALLAVVEAVKNGDTVKLSGFGTFSLKRTAARVGRNPRTGAAVKIPASTSLKFTASKAALE